MRQKKKRKVYREIFMCQRKEKHLTKCHAPRKEKLLICHDKKYVMHQIVNFVKICINIHNHEIRKIF